VGYLIKRVVGTGAVRYTAIYRDQRGRLRSAGTFGSKKAASTAWQRAEADITAGRIGDPQRGQQTLERYVRDEWFLTT
jgi:hypothetical protein